MANEYRVIFAGSVLEGFALEAVKQAAGERLKASPQQVDRLFSGRNAVLKKGLTQELGERYIAELRRIGMMVELDVQQPEAPAVDITAITTPWVAPAKPATVTKHTPAIASSDLEKTQIANPDALARYLRDDVDPSSAPTLIVPRTQVAAMTRQAAAEQDPSSMPTFVVPRSQLDETRRQIEQALSNSADPANAPTLIVPRSQVAEAQRRAQEALTDTNPANAPTLIVPRSQVAEAQRRAQEALVDTNPANAPTLIVPRSNTAKNPMTATVIVGQDAEHLRSNTLGDSKKHDPERTLIANEGALEAYLAANPGSSPMGNMTSTDITPASALPGHEVAPEIAPQPPKAAPAGSIRPRRTASLENVMELDAAAPAAAAVSVTPTAAAPLRPFQAHTSHIASDPAEQVDDGDYNNPDSASTLTGLSPKLQLALMAIGAACLLALIIWAVQ